MEDSCTSQIQISRAFARYLGVIEDMAIMTETDFSESCSFQKSLKMPFQFTCLTSTVKRDLRPRYVPIHALKCPCIEGRTVLQNAVLCFLELRCHADQLLQDKGMLFGVFKPHGSNCQLLAWCTTDLTPAESKALLTFDRTKIWRHETRLHRLSRPLDYMTVESVVDLLKTYSITRLWQKLKNVNYRPFASSKAASERFLYPALSVIPSKLWMMGSSFLGAATAWRGGSFGWNAACKAQLVLSFHKEHQVRPSKIFNVHMNRAKRWMKALPWNL